MFVHELHSNLQAFRAKLTCFPRNWPTRASHLSTLDVPLCHSNIYSSTLRDPHNQSKQCFSDFTKTQQELDLGSSPVSFSREKTLSDVQVELIKIQCNPALSETFTSSTLDHFSSSQKETAPKHAQACGGACFIWLHFCVQKNCFRSQLTNKHHSVIHISTSQMTSGLWRSSWRGNCLNCSH